MSLLRDLLSNAQAQGDGSPSRDPAEADAKQRREVYEQFERERRDAISTAECSPLVLWVKELRNATQQPVDC
jgi:hypothetical protein